MGYTHSWGWADSIADAKKFARWSADVKLLHVAYNENPPLNPFDQSLFPFPIPKKLAEGWDYTIRGLEGTGAPTFTRKRVCFNGNQATDNHCESFLIYCNDLSYRRFFYCKTAGKPYDLLVTAALVRFEHYFPQLAIYCGGGVEGLDDAAQLCKKVFGVGRNPLLDPAYCRYVDNLFGDRSA